MTKKQYSSRLKFIPVVMLVSFSLFFTSCTKEEILPEPNVISEMPSGNARLFSSVLPDVFGMYTHPDYLPIGNATSENNVLIYLRNKGGNMLNCYARTSLSTASGRSKFASFCRKAVNSYGVKLITCDIRETSEIAKWDAFYTSFPDLSTLVSPLTEKEPWNTLDYTGCFNLLRTTKAMCNRYGAKFYFYEGWMGANYAYPQRAVDSMVYHCDGVFLSNYVTVGDFLSTSAGYGKWDNRMKFRIDQGGSSFGGITVAAKKFNKLDYPIIELQSLEPVFLLTMYAVNAYNREFFGTLYAEAKLLYNLSSSDVLKYTSLKGKCIFYQKYALQAQTH